MQKLNRMCGLTKKSKFKIQALYPNLVYVIKPAKVMTIFSSFSFSCAMDIFIFFICVSLTRDEFVPSFNAKDVTYSHGDEVTDES